jgi:hypothetical protein
MKKHISLLLPALATLLIVGSLGGFFYGLIVLDIALIERSALAGCATILASLTVWGFAASIKTRFPHSKIITYLL